MSNSAKIDNRPEGGILLAALLIGEYTKALQLVVAAAASGYDVDTTPIYVPLNRNDPQALTVMHRCYARKP